MIGCECKIEQKDEGPYRTALNLLENKQKNLSPQPKQFKPQE